MLYLVVAASLQDIGEANDVAVDVGMGVLQRVADPGLGRQKLLAQLQAASLAAQAFGT